MQQELFEVEKDRFDLADPSVYRLQGCWPKGYEVSAMLDELPLSAEMGDQERISALERFQDLDRIHGMRVQMRIQLPPDLDRYQKLKVYAVGQGKKLLWFTAPAAQLAVRKGKPQYFLEEVQVDHKEKICRVRGWAAFGEPVRIYLEKAEGERIPCEIERINRVDVQNQFDEVKLEEKCGFFFELNISNLNSFRLVFQAGHVRTIRRIDLQPMKLLAQKAGEYYRKGCRYVKLYGIPALAEKSLGKIRDRKKKPMPYSKCRQ